MAEGIPTQKKESFSMTKEEVVRRLQENPTDLTPFLEWLTSRQEQVKTDADGNDLILETGEMYRDAGMVEAARDAFTDAAEQARQMHDDERYWRAQDELDKLP